MEWYIKCFKLFADFSGRARRKEYWMFVLYNILFASLAMLVDYVFGTGIIFYSLYILVALIPAISVAIRRLHDTGKSGWYFLMAFIPLVGGIILLVFFVTDSEAGDNVYGPNPKMGLDEYAA